MCFQASVNGECKGDVLDKGESYTTSHLEIKGQVIPEIIDYTFKVFHK